ncbi:MAG: cell envelope integrity protein TolA, partial [Rhodococcus sp.]|nr:cell envelope integrity protein TolA [Rhodococcus sp. (in: high G+C Gram-positive bacteria)]
ERERRRVEEQKKFAEAEELRKAEAQRKLEEESARAEEEKRRAEAEAKQREEARRAEEAQRAFESALAEDEEELALAQTRLRDKLLAEYSLAIQATVERNWIRPPGAPEQLECIVRVSQAPSGDVVTVQIVESSGNRAFDSSVEKAVWKSSPLPLPKDLSLFRRDLQFVFNPEG